MQKGDISNVMSPRLLVVFENLVGLLPEPQDRARYATYLRLHQWKRAVNCYQPNETLAKVLWDLTYGRFSYTLDCVTWLDDRLVEHVESWLDREGLPFSKFHHYDPTKLARRIATMPDVAAIYDPDPAHRFLWGSKGRIVSPENTTQMGRF